MGLSMFWTTFGLFPHISDFHPPVNPKTKIEKTDLIFLIEYGPRRDPREKIWKHKMF